MFQSDESYIIYRESPNWSKLAARENLLPIFYLFFFLFYTHRNLLNSCLLEKKKKITFLPHTISPKIKKISHSISSFIPPALSYNKKSQISKLIQFFKSHPIFTQNFRKYKVRKEFFSPLLFLDFDLRIWNHEKDGEARGREPQQRPSRRLVGAATPDCEAGETESKRRQWERWQWVDSDESATRHGSAESSSF